MKLCECGCGGVPLRKESKFLHGHYAKTQKARIALRERHKGEPSNHGDGYLTQWDAVRQKHSLHHRLIAEKALGKPLPPEAVVHHTDEAKGTIDPFGLVICPDESYHRLLHMRAKALRECGHADWRQCVYCKKWDAPANLTIRVCKGKNKIEHRLCGNAYRAEWTRKKRAKLKQ